MGIEVVHGTRGTKGSTEMWYRGWYRNTHTHYYSYITTFVLFLFIFIFIFLLLFFIFIIFLLFFFFRTSVYWIVITGGPQAPPPTGARALLPPLPRAGQSIMVDRST